MILEKSLKDTGESWQQTHGIDPFKMYLLSSFILAFSLKLQILQQFGHHSKKYEWKVSIPKTHQNSDGERVVAGCIYFIGNPSFWWGCKERSSTNLPIDSGGKGGNHWRHGSLPYLGLK